MLRNNVPNAPGIVWTDTTLFARMHSLDAKIARALAALVQRNAPAVQNYARRTAPWTDQTGNARQGLFARYAMESGSGRAILTGEATGEGAGVHTINLSHSVNYGIWLETRWAGKYAVIAPTIQREGARIMKSAERLLDRMTAVEMGGGGGE